MLACAVMPQHNQLAHTSQNRYQPQHTVNHLWMDCMTIATSWGLNRMEGPDNYQTAQQLIHILVDNVAFGGVLVLNVCPAADGSIIPIQQERLLEMGDWLSVNGPAIYHTKPYSVVQMEESGAEKSQVCQEYQEYPDTGGI